MLVENQHLKPSSFFTISAMVSVVGWLFILKVVKDTTHMTGRQKRQLYIPEAILNPVQKSPQGQGGSNIDIELQVIESKPHSSPKMKHSPLP